MGAFLTNGVSLHLDGPANDYVGKGMGGGQIVVVSSRLADIPQAAGNAVLYGATGGAAFIAGKVGQRFAVRNSGARTVVEGCSDHGCEYMTGGEVVVLGDVGRNFGAGMTGGRAFVWDPGLSFKGRVAATSPEPRRLTNDEEAELIDLLQRHIDLTSSPLAAEALADLGGFWIVDPGVSTQREAKASASFGNT